MQLAANLAGNRNLLKNLILRDLRHRYVGSVGGFLWSVVQPLVQLLIYSFAFTVVFQQRPESGGAGTAIFLFSGILPWFLFTDIVVRNCSVITDNAALVTKTIMPPEVLPIAITISNVINHGIGLAVLLAALALFHTVPLSVVGVLLYLPVLLLFAQGLGWMAAGFHVFFRDTAQILQLVLSAWFWLTPVMYGLERLGTYQGIATLNPMAVVVSGYRSSLLGLPQPAAQDMAVATLISVIVFLGGTLVFRQARPAFPDVL